MKKGDKAYIIESNWRVVPVEILMASGGLYTCRLPTGGAIRLKKGRIYETEEEAEKHIIKEEKPHRTPYDYMR